MKIKKVILLGAVAFFAALNVQAFFDPSTGRWASRDPIAEKGSILLREPNYYSTSDAGSLLGFDLKKVVQNATEQAFYKEEKQPYLFNANDSVNSIDKFGLMSVQDINNIIHQREAQAAGTPCSCSCKPDNIFFSIYGTSSGSTATGSALASGLGTAPCTLDPQIYWWDCYSAAAEGGMGGWFNNNWGDYGWSAGGISYSKTASPSWYSGLPVFSGYDPNHLAMVSLYIYDSCDHGKRTTMRIMSNRLLWTWDATSKQWANPSSF